MVARLLHLCGLYLGADAEMLPATADNPEGYWEHKGFLSINDEMLFRLGGEWSRPPQFAKHWQDSPLLEDLHPRAEELVRSFVGHEPWGWKDPRNCLTIPFWKQHVPDLRVIVCLRNPFDVALSLCRRDGFTIDYGLALYQACHEPMLECVPQSERLVTHYSSFFYDAPGELRRLLGALGLTASDKHVEHACITISPDLRHSSLSTAALLLAQREPRLLGTQVNSSLVATYQGLCEEAGPVFQAAREANEHLWALRNEVIRVGLEATLVNRERQLAEQGRQLAEQGRQLAEQGRQLAEQGRQLAEQGRQLAEQVQQLGHARATISAFEHSPLIGRYLRAQRQLRRWLGNVAESEPLPPLAP
jgi:hypothetical protein